MMDSESLLHQHHAPHITERCPCGREFYTLGAVSNHKRTCKKAKTHRFGALEKVQEVFRAAKKLKQSAQSLEDERFVTPSSGVSSSIVCDLTFYNNYESI